MMLVSANRVQHVPDIAKVLGSIVLLMEQVEYCQLGNHVSCLVYKTLVIIMNMTMLLTKW